MGKSNKIAKLRKDKYYNLAKLTGYRSRASFKLIQLNRKFGFLNDTTVAVDLCAAPGGWLQVLAKMMPIASNIVGVDLFPIKPIQNVTTLIGDITTAECQSEIKNCLQGCKADIVVHDGAPNLGTSWEIDAFGQNHLTLHSIRLMTKVLKTGGWFVSKVFRSKDYMKLVEILRKLFQHVHVTKPHASRKESAESFIVCQNFLGPKVISAEELEFKNVFKEDATADKVKASTLKSMVKNARKARANRAGYENSESQLIYSSIPLEGFLDKSQNVIALIQQANSINFDSSKYESDTPTIIKEYAKDLKVLGYSELKQLLDWRRMIQKKYELVEAKKEKEYVPLTAEERIEKEIKQTEEDNKALLKRQKKKERKSKRLQEIAMREGDSAQNMSNVDTGAYTTKRITFHDSRRRVTLGEDSLSSYESEEVTSDEEENKSGLDLDNQVDIQMEFMNDRRKNSKKNKIKYLKNTLEENEDSEKSHEYEEEAVLNEDAEMDVKFMMGMNETKEKKKPAPTIVEPSSSDLESDVDVEDKNGAVKEEPLTPEEMAVIAQMKRSKKKREDTLDDLWNRNCRGEELLPSWYVVDEAKARVPILPITKEEVEYFKKMQREINERPRKALLEAKARKRRRVNKILDELRKKTEQTNIEDEEMNPDKIDTLKKLYKKASKEVNAKKKKTYIVAKKHLSSGTRYQKPKGVKGPYKIVDPRMKKDKKVESKNGKTKKRSKTRMKRRR